MCQMVDLLLYPCLLKNQTKLFISLFLQNEIMTHSVDGPEYEFDEKDGLLQNDVFIV